MSRQPLFFSAVLLTIASALTACADPDMDMGADPTERVGAVAEGVGGTGSNNVSPQAIDAEPLKRSVTDMHGITSSSVADPIQLCRAGTVTSTGCTMKPEWEAWLNADSTPRTWMMKGIAKCSVEAAFTITTSDALQSFPGQWPLYPGWKSGRLVGQDKRERVSSCILSLLNGNNASLSICIIGPGAAPFSDACTDPNIVTREGGFFGDLFGATPTAYIAGPDAAEVANTGRVCTATLGSYCCAENDTACPHKIVLAGAIIGSPDQGFANKRCNGLAAAGSYEYCTSFHSTREPGRVYSNVFTTFVPVIP